MAGTAAARPYWSGLETDDEELDDASSASAEGEDESLDDTLSDEEKRLVLKQRKLQAMLAASKSRADLVAQQVDFHADQILTQQKQRKQVLEALSRQNQDIRAMQERQSELILQELEKLNSATQCCHESETRVQFLVERIVALLTSSSLSSPQIEELRTQRSAERDMLQRFEDIRQQYDEVRQQNTELTTRLQEESSLSRRLSEQLAEAEDRFLRCGNGAGEWQPQTPLTPAFEMATTPMTGSARNRGRIGEESVAEEDEMAHNGAVPPLPFSGRPHADLDGVSLAAGHVPRMAGDGEEIQGDRPGERPEASPVRGWGNTTLLAVPEAEATVGAGSSPGSGSSSEAQAGDARYREEATSNGLPESDTAAATGAAGQDDTDDPENHNLMESMLMQALDQAAFGYKVVRWQPGVYGFGNVKAIVQLDKRNRLMAASEVEAQRGLPFVPISMFLQQVVAAHMADQQDVVEEVDEEADEDTEQKPGSEAS